MLVTRYNPNTQFGEFRRGFNLLNSMLDTMQEQKSYALKDSFTPSVNTREGEFAYHVDVDLPGMKKEDINLQIEDKKLMLSGSRKSKEEINEEDYYKIESSFGSFSRTFVLPEDVDIENIHAESIDGVLEITLPKLESAKVEKIKKVTIK